MDTPTRHGPATQADFIIYVNKLAKWAASVKRWDTSVTDRTKENMVAFLEGGGTINAEH